MEIDQHKRPGFRVKDYFVAFPDGEFITENEDGSMNLAVDIFKIDVNNNLHPLDPQTKESEIEAIQPEIEAWVNTALENAIAMYEKDGEE